jgi:hypothetical protein
MSLIEGVAIPGSKLAGEITELVRDAAAVPSLQAGLLLRRLGG